MRGEDAGSGRGELTMSYVAERALIGSTVEWTQDLKPIVNLTLVGRAES